MIVHPLRGGGWRGCIREVIHLLCAHGLLAFCEAFNVFSTCMESVHL